MNVRERAFHQMLTWLDNDKTGEEPKPPEGLHPMAIEEWNAGAISAQKDFDESDAAWQGVEDLIVYSVKTSIVLSIVGVIYWLHEPWVLLAGGSAIAALLWRWKL